MPAGPSAVRRIGSGTSLPASSDEEHPRAFVRSAVARLTGGLHRAARSPRADQARSRRARTRRARAPEEARAHSQVPGQAVLDGGSGAHAFIVIIVDSSVWIDYFNGASTRESDYLSCAPRCPAPESRAAPVRNRARLGVGRRQRARTSNAPGRCARSRPPSPAGARSPFNGPAQFDWVIRFTTESTPGSCSATCSTAWSETPPV